MRASAPKIKLVLSGGIEDRELLQTCDVDHAAWASRCSASSGRTASCRRQINRVPAPPAASACTASADVVRVVSTQRRAWLMALHMRRGVLDRRDDGGVGAAAADVAAHVLADLLTVDAWPSRTQATAAMIWPGVQ